MSKNQGGRIRPPGPDPKAGPGQILQFAALKSLTLCSQWLPMSLVQFLGTQVGNLAYWATPRNRKFALLNLDNVFQDRKSEQEKQLLVKECYRHFGRALLETLRLSKLGPDNYREWVNFDNLDALKKPIEAGNGALLCTAHYGNWEVMNLALGYAGVPMSVMARPMDNPLAHRLLEKIRTKPGNIVIYKHKSVRKLLAALKDNRVVGIVNDQNVHDRNRIMSRFFGQEAATTPVPAAVAYRTGVPLVTGYAVPQGGGHYLVRFDDPIYADQDADKEDEIKRITELLNRRLEQQILQLPHCWFWVHKRFKTGAAGESTFYKQKRKT